MTEYIEREVLKEAFEEDGHLTAYVEDMIDSIPAADVRPVVNGLHDFCDKVRDRMTAMIDPMSKRAEEMTHKELYRSWIELWWWLDHYCEREPPTWGDESET